LTKNIGLGFVAAGSQKDGILDLTLLSVTF